MDEWLDERQSSVVDQSAFSKVVESSLFIDQLQSNEHHPIMAHAKYGLLRCPLEDFEPRIDNSVIKSHLRLDLTGNLLVVGLDENTFVSSVSLGEIPVINAAVKWSVHFTKIVISARNNEAARAVDHAIIG